MNNFADLIPVEEVTDLTRISNYIENVIGSYLVEEVTDLTRISNKK